jgi:uncharacterized membrane protein
MSTQLRICSHFNSKMAVDALNREDEYMAAITFLTPLFKVILSGLLLKESLTLSLWIGLGLVAAGIYSVMACPRIMYHLLS